MNVETKLKNVSVKSCVHSKDASLGVEYIFTFENGAKIRHKIYQNNKWFLINFLNKFGLKDLVIYDKLSDAKEAIDFLGRNYLVGRDCKLYKNEDSQKPYFELVSVKSLPKIDYDNISEEDL